MSAAKIAKVELQYQEHLNFISLKIDFRELPWRIMRNIARYLVCEKRKYVIFILYD